MAEAGFRWVAMDAEHRGIGIEIHCLPTSRGRVSVTIGTGQGSSPRRRGPLVAARSPCPWLVDTAHRTARRSHSPDSRPSAQAPETLSRRRALVSITLHDGSRAPAWRSPASPPSPALVPRPSPSSVPSQRGNTHEGREYHESGWTSTPAARRVSAYHGFSSVGTPSAATPQTTPVPSGVASGGRAPRYRTAGSKRVRCLRKSVGSAQGSPAAS